MAVQGRNRALGSNVSVEIYANDGSLQELNDIDSLEITNNDSLMTYRPLGAVFPIHDIDIGDLTLDITCGKSGTKTASLFKQIEEIHKRALQTPLYYVIVKTELRDGSGVEEQRFRDCVMQFKSESFSDAGSQVTQKITITAAERIFSRLQ